MACSKYILTNTGSTLVNFNYRRCDDSLWQYQIELEPNQSKNIWLINNTYSIASSFRNSVVLVNQGAFPLTPTPTPSITPSLTPTTTPTPTASRYSFSVYSGSSVNDSCGQINPSIIIYGDQSLFDNNTVFYDTIVGPSIQTLTGYFNYSQTIVQLSAGTETGGFSVCSTLTPTPTQTQTQTQTPTNTGTPTPTPTNTQTQTNTPTNTQTQTNTPTNTQTQTPTPTNTGTPTPTPTPTFAYYTYSLGTGATSNDSCTNFTGSPVTIYGTVSGGIGPNVGEFLYETPGIPLTDVVPDGYYSNGTAWFLVSGGLGQITSSDPNGCV
jgi:hypothetical protein